MIRGSWSLNTGFEVDHFDKEVGHRTLLYILSFNANVKNDACGSFETSLFLFVKRFVGFIICIERVRKFDNVCIEPMFHIFCFFFFNLIRKCDSVAVQRNSVVIRRTLLIFNN